MLPPEDRYFSEVMLKQKIGNLASYDEAKKFSQESVKSENSFGGHQFWLADTNWEERLNKLKYLIFYLATVQQFDLQSDK